MQGTYLEEERELADILDKDVKGKWAIKDDYQVSGEIDWSYHGVVNWNEDTMEGTEGKEKMDNSSIR